MNIIERQRAEFALSKFGDTIDVKDYRLALIVMHLQMKYVKDEFMKTLSKVQLVNPKLISDGYGEFPDVYGLSEEDLKRIQEKISE